MRLNNTKEIGYFNFIFTLLNVVLIGGILGFFFGAKILPFLMPFRWLFLVLPVVLYIVFYIRGRQIFLYDSDGEALNFTNRGTVFFLGKDAKDEFPKYKLKSFDIVNGLIFKRLFVTIKGKKGDIVLKYDISYLSGKETTDLRQSLLRAIRGG